MARSKGVNGCEKTALEEIALIEDRISKSDYGERSDKHCNRKGDGPGGQPVRQPDWQKSEKYPRCRTSRPPPQKQ